MFRDREEAGRRLAQKLVHLRGGDVVLLALPPGGVPVAAALEARRMKHEVSDAEVHSLLDRVRGDRPWEEREEDGESEA